MHETNVVEGESARPQNPLVSGQPGRSDCFVTVQREPQAGDDRVLEAAARGAVSGGDLDGVAELREAPVGEPAGRSAREGAAIDRPVDDGPEGVGEAALSAPNPAQRLVAGVLLRSDSDARDHESHIAYGAIRDLGRQRPGERRGRRIRIRPDPISDPRLRYCVSSPRISASTRRPFNVRCWSRLSVSASTLCQLEESRRCASFQYSS